MTELLVFGSLFGAGILLVLTSQPHGAPRATLRSRLEALTPRPDLDAVADMEPAFRTRFLEELLRAPLERAGDALSRLLVGVGVSPRATEERLRAAGDRGGVGLFVGQKLAGGIIGFVFLPVADSVGVGPSAPVWVWVLAGAGGFLLPDVLLKSRAQARRRVMREELIHLAELLSLAVSGGLGIEGALEGAISNRRGALFDEVRRLARESRVRGKPGSAALLDLPDEIGLRDAESLASAVRAATVHGTPVTQALRGQARALRDRRRLELVEAGERAQIRMLLPTGLLILPAFFVLVLYPAAVQLLKVTGP